MRGFDGAVERGDLAGGLGLLAPGCSCTEMDGLARARLTVDGVLDAGDSVVGVRSTTSPPTAARSSHST